MLTRFLRDLPGNHAETRPDHSDPTLRTCRWDRPFEQVWNAARALAEGGIEGWSMVDSDPEAGVIRAEVRTSVFRFVDDVQVRLWGQGEWVSVDVESRSRIGVTDLGANPRRIRRFLTELRRRTEDG